jgi:undecaprenyl-diphosphatase
MEPLQIIVIGIVQGIIEWLPISSQGNIIILMVEFLNYNIENALKLSIILHLGTVISAGVYFRKNIVEIIANIKNYKFGYEGEINSLTTFILISTISSSIVGLVIFSNLMNIIGSNIILLIIGSGLIVTGIIQRTVKSAIRTNNELNHYVTIITGILQGFAVIPGISRSGITTSYLLLNKYEPQTALRLSFIMSIPAVIIANLYLLIIEGINNIQLTEILLAVFVTSIIGFLSIRSFINIAGKIKFWLFTIIIGLLLVGTEIINLISL